ncbi:hypothetical protein NMY22_g17031 [Coprinellus aureogranulatus]|nr:hypothetical protein NMY22_g17031 [Coprinellus aureogranulatus]
MILQNQWERHQNSDHSWMGDDCAGQAPQPALDTPGTSPSRPPLRFPSETRPSRSSALDEVSPHRNLRKASMDVILDPWRPSKERPNAGKTISPAGPYNHGAEVLSARQRSARTIIWPSPRVFPHQSRLFGHLILDGRAAGATAHPFHKHNIPCRRNVLLQSAYPALSFLDLRLCLPSSLSPGGIVRYKQDHVDTVRLPSFSPRRFLRVRRPSSCNFDTGYGWVVHPSKFSSWTNTRWVHIPVLPSGPVLMFVRVASARHEGRWEECSRRCERRRAMHTTYSIAGPPWGLRGRVHVYPPSSPIALEFLCNWLQEFNLQEPRAVVVLGIRPSRNASSDRSLPDIYPSLSLRRCRNSYSSSEGWEPNGSAFKILRNHCDLRRLGSAATSLSIRPMATHGSTTFPLPSFLNIQFHGRERSKTGDDGSHCVAAEEVAYRHGFKGILSPSFPFFEFASRKRFLPRPQSLELTWTFMDFSYLVPFLFRFSPLVYAYERILSILPNRFHITRVSPLSDIDATFRTHFPTYRNVRSHPAFALDAWGRWASLRDVSTTVDGLDAEIVEGGKVVEEGGGREGCMNMKIADNTELVTPEVEYRVLGERAFHAEYAASGDNVERGREAEKSAPDVSQGLCGADARLEKRNRAPIEHMKCPWMMRWMDNGGERYKSLFGSIWVRASLDAPNERSTGLGDWDRTEFERQECEGERIAQYLVGSLRDTGKKRPVPEAEAKLVDADRLFALTSGALQHDPPSLPLLLLCSPLPSLSIRRNISPELITSPLPHLRPCTPASAQKTDGDWIDLLKTAFSRPPSSTLGVIIPSCAKTHSKTFQPITLLPSNDNTAAFQRRRRPPRRPHCTTTTRCHLLALSAP